MKDALLSFARRHGMFSPGDRVLVAFSGGADSTCLLHLLVETDLDVAAAHLHHSQRPEGDADVEHCRTMCEELGIPMYAGRADVPGVAAAHKIGVEEAGRKLRYEFLQMVASDGFDRIATGHTMNDNLESMLLHLARGAGMKGLAGIPPVRGNIVRPVLFLERRETHAYCEEHNLRYVQDSYNEDESFSRNLVRGKAVPALESTNSLAVRHAFTTSEVLREEDLLLDSIASAHLSANEIVRASPLEFMERRIAAEWRPMPDLPFALLRRCIRQATAMYGGSLDFAATQALAESIHKGEKASFTCEGGTVVVSASDDRWSVSDIEGAQAFRELLTIPGETIAEDLGWRLAAWEGETEASPLTGCLDPTKVKGDLYARSLKSGDKIDPPGRGDKKLLSERLSRAGVSAGVRSRIPIVCDMVGPVWAPLVGVDKRVRAPETPGRKLALQLGPADEPIGNAEAV